MVLLFLPLRALDLLLPPFRLALIPGPLVTVGLGGTTLELAGTAFDLAGPVFPKRDPITDFFGLEFALELFFGLELAFGLVPKTDSRNVVAGAVIAGGAFFPVLFELI